MHAFKTKGNYPWMKLLYLILNLRQKNTRWMHQVNAYVSCSVPGWATQNSCVQPLSICIFLLESSIGCCLHWLLALRRFEHLPRVQSPSRTCQWDEGSSIRALRAPSQLCSGPLPSKALCCAWWACPKLPRQRGREHASISALPNTGRFDD